MRVVKSFVREAYEKEKFHHAAEEVCQDFTRAEKILAINSPLMQFCLYVVMIFVLSFGSYTIITTRRPGSGRRTVFCPFSIQLPDIK